MIEQYVNKLIENLPIENIKNQRLDLVLDGGIFNGSYLIGALYFLKEMERRNYVKIERISGCSIGSLVAFLYFIDAFDLMPTLYNIVKDEFKSKFSLRSIKNLKSYLKDRIPPDICDKVNGRLFICYNNVKLNKKVVKCTYKNIDDIIDTIIKSCYIPFLIDNCAFYKNKYVDGINAFIFEPVPKKKILFMDLLGFDKITHTLNIKNEKSNFHRILTGLLDIHSFYIKNSSTSMCSYVNDWSLLGIAYHNVRLLLERIIIYILLIIVYIEKYLTSNNINIKDNIFIKIGSCFLFDTFSIIFNTYFL